MPEARDRRATPLDVATLFARRRASILGGFDHQQLDTVLFGSTPTPASPTGPARGFGTPRTGAGRAARFGFGSPGSGAENASPLRRTVRRGGRGRGRGSNRSVLPSWYPRTPLRDITAVVRAIERRRFRLGEIEGQQTGIQIFQDPPEPSVDAHGAHLEPGSSVSSSNKAGVKLRTPGGKVPKIILDIANQSEGGSEITPQKKLLNSIDDVEKVVKEELQRLRRTPSAKKAERERKVRTLMSMR